MPWRLLSYILTLVVIVCFIGLNLENKSDIDLWFNGSLSFENVPIFISLFIAYILGAFSVVPYWVKKNILSNRKKKKSEKDSNSQAGGGFTINTSTASESVIPENDKTN